MKVAPHFGVGLAFVFRTTRPARDVRNDRIESCCRSIGERQTVIDRPYRDASRFKRDPSTKVLGYFRYVPPGPIPLFVLGSIAATQSSSRQDAQQDHAIDNFKKIGGDI